MKTELKVKFLQFLLGKKKNPNEGFTLIELLVVVIIIGVLAAIALPNFLNQTAKAKQSEAKNTITSVNSAQTSYRQEKNSFAKGSTVAATLDLLALGLPTQTANYIYNITGDTNIAQITAATKDDALKGYSGANERYQNANSESVIASVICEGKTPGDAAPAPTAPNVRPGTGTACTGTSVELGQQ